MNLTDITSRGVIYYDSVTYMQGMKKYLIYMDELTNKTLNNF